MSAVPAAGPAPGATPMAAFLPPIWRERRAILLASLAVSVVVLLVSFLLLPVYYRSTATLLPEAEKSKIGALSQAAGLAQLAGVAVSAGEVARLYPTIAASETVLRPVIERAYQTRREPEAVNLVRYFGIDEETPEENMDEALKELRELLSTSYDTKTSVVTIALEMREPQLAADVLNAVVDEIDRFMRQKRTTSASEQARWIADRLQQVERELREAEEALKRFREKNRRVVDSPELLLQQERLLREVTVKSTMYVELKKQHELVKIEEIKNITVVNVLDRARAPVKKERPRRALAAAVAFLLTLAAASAGVGVRDVYGGRIGAFVRGITRGTT